MQTDQPSNQPAEVSDALTIQWYGQAAFLLSSGATRILIDPVLPDLGYKLPQFEQLDAVLVTHLHHDHSYVSVAPTDALKLFGLNPEGHFQPCHQQVGAATVYNVAAFHDNVAGAERGEDALWVVELAGLRVVHLGDLGQQQLTAEQLTALGRPDVLLIPVGGGPTINGGQARQIARQLQPRLTIPMHYRTPLLPAQVPLHGPEAFLGGPQPTNNPHTITVRAAELAAASGRVIVMAYE